MQCETRGERTCKTNVLIFVAEIIQGYNGIKQDNPYNFKISERWGERTRVKKLVSLKGILNNSLKISLLKR